jgi:hypothetical protein
MISLRPTVGMIAAALIIALAVGFIWGRRTSPTKVEIREKLITKTVEVAAREKVESLSNEKQVAIRTVTRWRTAVITRPDGTVERTAAGETGASSTTDERKEESRREVEIKYVDKFVDREVVKVVTTEAASWGLALRVGVRERIGNYEYGVEASRRVLGPLRVGAYATTSKAFGLSVGVQW